MLKLHKSCDTNHIFMIMSVIRQYNEISHREQISHKYLQYKTKKIDIFLMECVCLCA